MCCKHKWHHYLEYDLVAAIEGQLLLFYFTVDLLCCLYWTAGIRWLWFNNSLFNQCSDFLGSNTILCILYNSQHKLIYASLPLDFACQSVLRLLASLIRVFPLTMCSRSSFTTKMAKKACFQCISYHASMLPLLWVLERLPNLPTISRDQLTSLCHTQLDLCLKLLQH